MRRNRDKKQIDFDQCADLGIYVNEQRQYSALDFLVVVDHARLSFPGTKLGIERESGGD